ncbi:msr7929 [Mesorhizobium japonicum MAFF 303099]|uniref:Msr7929 protein n=1 Tax=Mesorhizobium japonicum (strain LMG 29417 / CECT 9101 / MAFF 303099) TaxID=266835 RepID=Q984N0_RHILO|nr:msr7929 [Mesorhizobium japonicum MAFF 303099]
MNCCNAYFEAKGKRSALVLDKMFTLFLELLGGSKPLDRNQHCRASLRPR